MYYGRCVYIYVCLYINACRCMCMWAGGGGGDDSVCSCLHLCVHANVYTRSHMCVATYVCIFHLFHHFRGLSEQAERRRQRHLRKEQKLLRRAQRQEERQQRRGQRRGKKKKSCNGRSMKCFSHDNDHWKTPPYWDCKSSWCPNFGCPNFLSVRTNKQDPNILWIVTQHCWY